MVQAFAQILSLFKKEIPAFYFRNNHEKKVKYPYATMTYTAEPLRENVRGFFLDIDIFDNKGIDEQRIEEITTNFIDFIEKETILNEQYYIRFEYKTSNPIPTNSDTLQRRYIQVYCTIDWRKK